MGCGSDVICNYDQYCDAASGMCSECSLLCTGGHDDRCQYLCCCYLSHRPPTSSTSSTVGGSAVPVYGPKETPQSEACSCVALYVILSLALLLLGVVMLLVVKHYRKDIKGIFNQCKDRFLTRHGSSSSREVDAEAQPLIDHWTEIVTCWRDLTKLLHNKDPSQTEDEAVDCTWAQMAVDFNRWAGLFLKHGDRVLYTRHVEAGEDRMAGGCSEQSQAAAEFTGERSRHQTTITEPRDKNVKPRSDKQADPSEMPPAQQPSEPPRSPAHGTVEHSSKKGVAVKVTKFEAAAPYKAEPNDPENNTLQPNLTTPQSSPRRSSPTEAADRESSIKQAQTPRASETIPQGTVPSSNAVPGTSTTINVTTHSKVKDGHPPPSPTKVPHSSNSKQQDSGAQRAQGYQRHATQDPKTTIAARPEKQGVQTSAFSRRARGAQTSTPRASQTPDHQPTGTVQCTNGGNADRAVNNHRAAEHEEGGFNLLSDNSGGAAESAQMGGPTAPGEAAVANDETPPPPELYSVTLASDGPQQAPVQSRAASNDDRAEGNEGDSPGAAAAAPKGAAAPAPEEGLSISLDLRSDGHQETSSMESGAAPSPFDRAISRLRERSKSIPGVRFRAVTIFKNYLELYVAIDDRSMNIQTVTRRALEIAGLGSSKLLVIEGTPLLIDPV